MKMKMKNIIIIFFLPTLIHAASFTDSMTSLGNTLALGATQIIGNTDISLQCSLDFNSLGGNMRSFSDLDLCRNTQALYDLTKGGLSFKIGPCDITGNNPLMCSAKKLNDFCQTKLNLPVKEIAGLVRISRNNILDVGRAKLLVTGGVILAKETACDVPLSFSKQLPELSRAKNAITKLNGTPAYGHIINTRQYRMSVECYEGMLKAGKSDGEATRYCTPQSIGSNTTGATSVEIEKSSIATVKETLSNPLKNASSESFTDEAQLRKWIEDGCKNATTDASASACAKNIINTRYKMKEKTVNIEADIESKEAGRAYLFESATSHQKTLTHPTEEYKAQLPIELRKAYADTARKSLAQQTVIEVFNKRISDTKKELATIMMQKTEMAAKPFYPEVETNKIMAELNNANAF
jgi:hypothetical protein